MSGELALAMMALAGAIFIVSFAVAFVLTTWSIRRRR